MVEMSSKVNILIVEPFYGGSHKQFIDTLLPLAVDYDQVLGDRLPKDAVRKKNKWPTFQFSLFEMSAKKWHWRARTSALYLSQAIPKVTNNNQFDILFASSVLNLAELVALRPDLAQIKCKILYFHENQLVYPVQVQKERDFQYGYNQILSSMVADVVVFNSHYNRDSFLLNIKPFLRMMPDYRLSNLEDLTRSIAQKSQVLYYPIKFCNIPLMHAKNRQKKVLHIIWPHRWEHDKNPDAFFRILFRLKEEKVHFKVSVLGESFSEIPVIFQDAKEKLKDEVVHWGYTQSKEDYYEILAGANVALSTAIHEFFGVSMLEAAYCGCYPLCPSRLVYPELFPAQYLYKTEDECVEKLKMFANSPERIPMPLDIAYETIDWIYSQDGYRALFSGKLELLPNKTAAAVSATKANTPSSSPVTPIVNHK